MALPSGIKSSGFPAVRETCRRIGINFDDWQNDLNKCLLAKGASGKYAADTSVMSIPRQVGKTFDVGAVAFALCIADPGLTVVWTAHRFKVARESFNEMRSWAKGPELAPHIDYDTITTAAGNETIPFRNGARIVFAARERGAIRGFTKVGMLVLDEAQILTEAAMSDLVPTTNQSPNPLIILMGTPPKPTDPSEVFTRLRQEALSPESGDVLYVEFSADEGADPNDREQWRKANPSYPKRTPQRAIKRMQSLLSPEDFMREGLGVWDVDASLRVFPRADWEASIDRASRIVSHFNFAVDVSMDRSRTAIGVAGWRDDGRVHGEFIQESGTSHAPARLAELVGKWGGTVALDPSSPAGSLIPALSEMGIEPRLLTAGEAAGACALHYDTVTTDKFRHLGQPELNDAVSGATRKNLGDGAYRWSRKDSLVNIAPLYAVTFATFLVASVPPEYDVLDSVF